MVRESSISPQTVDRQLNRPIKNGEVIFVKEKDNILCQLLNRHFIIMYARCVYVAACVCYWFRFRQDAFTK